MPKGVKMVLEDQAKSASVANLPDVAPRHHSRYKKWAEAELFAHPQLSAELVELDIR